MDALIEDLRETIEKADELLNQTNKSESRISLYVASLEKRIDRLCGYEKVDGATDQSKEIWVAATKAQLKLSDELAKLRNGSRISPSRTGPRDPSVIKSSTFLEYLKQIEHIDFCIRRTLYLKWSNSTNVKSMFHDLFRLILNYFDQNVVEFNDDILNRDILDSIMNQKSVKEPVNVKEIDVILEVNDFPISTPVLIAENILTAHYRSSATSILNEVGCQHVFLHDEMVDSSSASSPISSAKSSSGKRKNSSVSNSSSCESSVDSDDRIAKKAKTSQIACRVDLNKELPRHQKNSTSIKGTPVIVDVLLFIPQRDTLEKVVKHLGLISIDEIIRDANIQADLANPDAKVYRVIQSFINRDLIFGHSNVCATSNENVFEIVRANVKVALLEKAQNLLYSNVLRHSSIAVDIPNKIEIFYYIAGIARVIEIILKTESSVDVTYCRCDTYYKLKLPLCSIIPMYILIFFSQILFSKSNLRFNFLDIK